MLILFCAIILSYLIGAIPTAFLAGKFIKGIDIRTIGSGNVGATNVYRSVGKFWGFVVLFVDIMKGVLPVLVIPYFLKVSEGVIRPDIYKIIIGMFAIIGHVWTVFLRFKGGKGVATTAGVLVVLAPKVVGIAFLIWVIVVSISRYVSVASIIAAFSLPITAWILGKPHEITLFLMLLGAVGIYKHKANMARLMKGKENKIF